MATNHGGKKSIQANCLLYFWVQNNVLWNYKFREKAAKEAGINDGEDEENEDDGDVMGGPFRNITDQIVSAVRKYKRF